MEHEEKLDLLLEHLRALTSTTDLKSEKLVPTHIPEINSESLMRPLLKQLVADGYVENWVIQDAFKIRIKGIVFLRDGGYRGEQKSKLEKEELERQNNKLSLEAIEISRKSIAISNDSLNTSKKNTFWVIVGVIVAIAALGISIYAAIK